MAPTDHDHSEMPTRLADRFVVQDEIGAGATSVTYRGWDERLERPVAIKILRRDHSQDDTYVQRFRQEARSAASVAHGNVVDVYDFGRQDGALYIVMQLIDGGDLKHLIHHEAPLPLERIRRIAGQVLDGLQAIHAAGIVHRDIKPQNVLIGRDGQARVTDFGVAHLEQDSGLTTVGTTVGTAAYMAPEQAQGGRISEACDIYAVGVMLYEMLTGFLPFNGPTPMATMLEHIQSTPTPPSHRMPGHRISPDLDGVILQALEKDPARRFRSARAMKQALGQAFRASIDAGRDDMTRVVSPAMTARYTAPESSRVEYDRRPREVAAPVPSRRASDPMEGYRLEEDAGSGLNGAVKALLTLLLVVALGLGAWLAYDTFGLPGGSSDPTSTAAPGVVATETSQPTQPPATDAPTDVPTDAPTEASAPTDQPIETLIPTATEQIIAPPPTRTPVPTAPTSPTPTPTSDVPIIEPIEITPPN